MGDYGGAVLNIGPHPPAPHPPTNTTLSGSFTKPQPSPQQLNSASCTVSTCLPGECHPQSSSALPWVLLTSKSTYSCWMRMTNHIRDLIFASIPSFLLCVTSGVIQQETAAQILYQKKSWSGA
ncbi:hypothetical protein Pmani_015923 [Petrolisthes manimaculis]|uniref:Uncharacterized protein n=1 Tax=Petrolisthes manimaculis TaxID=1843537 RepID=A0AAE1PQP4_9EUCA|nr:hypothetical protein Pmani_015923 [Petrolisthes manimaculis]